MLGPGRHNDTLANSQNPVQLRYRDAEKLPLPARPGYGVVVLNERHEGVGGRVERNENA